MIFVVLIFVKFIKRRHGELPFGVCHWQKDMIFKDKKVVLVLYSYCLTKRRLTQCGTTFFWYEKKGFETGFSVIQKMLRNNANDTNNNNGATKKRMNYKFLISFDQVNVKKS